VSRRAIGGLVALWISPSSSRSGAPSLASSMALPTDGLHALCVPKLLLDLSLYRHVADDRHAKLAAHFRPC